MVIMSPLFLVESALVPVRFLESTRTGSGRSNYPFASFSQWAVGLQKLTHGPRRLNTPGGARILRCSVEYFREGISPSVALSVILLKTTV